MTTNERKTQLWRKANALHDEIHGRKHVLGLPPYYSYAGHTITRLERIIARLEAAKNSANPRSAALGWPVNPHMEVSTHE